MAAETDNKAAEVITWPYTFPLSKPREVLGETYSSLTLREPTAAEFVKYGLFDDTINGDRLLDLVGVLSGLTPATIRALPGIDMLRLSKKLMQVFSEAAQ